MFRYPLDADTKILVYFWGYRLVNKNQDLSQIVEKLYGHIAIPPQEIWNFENHHLKQRTITIQHYQRLLTENDFSKLLISIYYDIISFALLGNNLLLCCT